MASAIPATATSAPGASATANSCGRELPSARSTGKSSVPVCVSRAMLCATMTSMATATLSPNSSSAKACRAVPRCADAAAVASSLPSCSCACGAGQPPHLGAEGGQAGRALFQVERQARKVAHRAGEPVVEGAGQVDRGVAGERDVRGRARVAQVRRAPDDPDHAHRGQPERRLGCRAIQYLCHLIGPEPAERDHRADVGVQHPRGRFVDHCFADPGGYRPPPGHQDRVRLRWAVDQRPADHIAGIRGTPAVAAVRKGEHERAPLAVRDAGQGRDLAHHPLADVGHLAFDRARVLQEAGDGRVGPAGPGQRHQHHGAHQPGDQGEHHRPAPVLAQASANAQPDGSHPTPRRCPYPAFLAIVPGAGSFHPGDSTTLGAEASPTTCPPGGGQAH